MIITYIYSYKNFKMKELSKFPIQLDIPVRWADMDAFKHVNNVIIYDEIREGEERLKKMSEDSIYIPKYIPQLPSEQ